MSDVLEIVDISTEAVQVVTQGPQGATGPTGPAGSTTFGTIAGTSTEGNDGRIANIGSGTINTNQTGGGSGTVGNINTSTAGDGVGGYIDTSAINADGGYIDTHGENYVAGGNINTSNGGGSIDTRGTGSIELGASGMRTTLNGSAGTTNKTITLPNATGTVALTTDLHSRSHAVTSTSDHTAGNNKVFYSNGSGQIVELSLGSANTVLTSSGATSAPTFSALPSGGSKTYFRATALDNQPPASSFATLDTRNSIAVLDFDDAATESAVFVGTIPEGASLGSGLIVYLHFMATTATSGNVRWSVAFERSNTDLDSDSFDTATAATVATNGTSGIVTVASITCTTIDSVTAGDLFRVRVQRLGADAADTMTGDAELVAVEIRSAA